MDDPTQADPRHTVTLVRKARSGRIEDRQDALDRLQAMSRHARRELTLELMRDRYAGAREVALTAAREELDADLARDLLDALDAGGHAGFAQTALLVLREFPSEDDPAVAEAIDAVLRELLERGEPADVRYQAIVACELRAFSDDAYRDALVERLRADKDSEIRAIAAQGLARLGAHEAREHLRDQLERARGDERFHLVLTLAELGEPGLIPHFERALRRGAYRFAALGALGDYGDPEAIPLLLDASRKRLFGEPLERVAAARSLAWLGDARGFERLEQQAESRRPEVRGYARECLEALSRDHPEAALRDQALALLDALPEAPMG